MDRANTAAAAARFKFISKPLVPAKPALIPAESFVGGSPNAKAIRTWPNLGTMR